MLQTLQRYLRNTPLIVLSCFVLFLSACGGSDGGPNASKKGAQQEQSADKNNDTDTSEDSGKQDPNEPEVADLFAEPRVSITETRKGDVWDHEINVPMTGDVMAITVMEPTEMKAGEAYPLVLHGHGYGGHRNHEPDDFQQRLRDEGYYVITIDQRGFGESSGTVRIMSPDYEGQDLIALLDWAEELPGLARFADDKMVVGSYGGSYGGMYQYLLASIDPEERLRVIAPDMTPYDLSYSLASHNVPKTGWAAGLAAMGEVPILSLFTEDFPEEFMRFLQKELVGDNTRGNLTNQDPIVIESLARGLVAGKLSESTANMLEYHSLRYFCEGEAAKPQDNFILGNGDPMEVLPKPLPKIDALISQGMNDTLFNFNEAHSAYQCLGEQGGDVRLITHQSGHILPIAPDLLPDWNEKMDWMYAMFRPPEFQKPGGGEDCGSTDRYDATFSWFEEKLKGKTGSLDGTLRSDKNVCLSLEDGDAVHVDEVKVGGELAEVDMDTPAMSGPFGLLASTAGSLPSKALLQTQPVYEVPKDGSGVVLAGIPTLDVEVENVLGKDLTLDTCIDPLEALPVTDLLDQLLKEDLPVEDVLGTVADTLDETISLLPLVDELPLVSGLLDNLASILRNALNLPSWITGTVSDALPLACDPIYFISLAKQTEGHQRWDIINNQVTPIRGYGSHQIELNGVADQLNPGDKLGLMIMGGNLQYPLSFSRDLLTIFTHVNGTIGLPLLTEDEIVRIDKGNPVTDGGGVFPPDDELLQLMQDIAAVKDSLDFPSGLDNLVLYLKDLAGGYVPMPNHVPSSIQVLADHFNAIVPEDTQGDPDIEILAATGHYFTELADGKVTGDTQVPDGVVFLADHFVLLQEQQKSQR